MSKSRKVKWIENTLIRLEASLTLCTSEKQFQNALYYIDRLDYKEVFVSKDAYATTHWLRSNVNKNQQALLIGIRLGLDPIDAASLLVHEAVHCFQHQCEHMNENNPSSEFQAYSIQNISHALMLAYRDELK